MNLPTTRVAAVLAVMTAPLAALANPDPRQGQVVEQMVVTASGFAQDRTLAPGSITVISREDLLSQPVANLADVLRNLAGIDVDGLDARSNKTGNRVVSLRGLPSEYTLVLIDGKRQNVPGTVAPNSFGDSASVFFPPLEAIERIEIVRSPMSTLYGADALAGVVNIITRQPGETWTGSASLSSVMMGDSDFGGERTLEGFLAGPLGGNAGLRLYGRAWERSASQVEFPGQDQSLDRRRTMGQVPVKADVQTLGSRLGWRAGANNEFHLGFDLTRQSYDNRFGQLGRINQSAAPGTAAFPDLRSGYAPELGFNRDQYYAGHEGQFGNTTWLTTLSRNEVETTGRTIPDAAATEASGRRGTARRLESDTTVLDSKVITDLDSHRLSIGLQYIEARMFDGIPNRRFESSQWGVFVEDEWQLTDRLAFTGGLRYDKNDAFGGQFTPRLYAVYRATDELVLKGGIGRGYRAPFLEQLEAGVIGFGEGGTVPLFGNPDLKPEKSTNMEVSAIWTGAPVSGEVTLFYTELDNRIERPVGATGGVTANIGEARIQGAELSGSWRFSPAVSLDANYTFIDSEITSEGAVGLNRGDPLFGVPRHAINSRLNWQLGSRISSYLGTQYRSSRFRPDSFHEPHLGGTAQGATEVLGDFRGFTTFSLGGQFDLTDNVQVRAVIENLLDKDFNDYRAYPLRNNPDVIAFSNVYNNIYEPRRLWLGLTAAF
jgi:outer membrane receptor for ferrienterochelin and colicins